MKRENTKLMMYAFAISSLLLTAAPAHAADGDDYSYGQQDGDRGSERRDGARRNEGRNEGKDDGFSHDLSRDKDEGGRSFEARAVRDEDGTIRYYDMNDSEIKNIVARQEDGVWRYRRDGKDIPCDDSAIIRDGEKDFREGGNRFAGIDGVRFNVAKKDVREDWNHPVSWDEDHRMKPGQRACLDDQKRQLKEAFQDERVREYFKYMADRHMHPSIKIVFYQKVGDEKIDTSGARFGLHRKAKASEFVLPVLKLEGPGCKGNSKESLLGFFHGEFRSLKSKVDRKKEGMEDLSKAYDGPGAVKTQQLQDSQQQQTESTVENAI